MKKLKSDYIKSNFLLKNLNFHSVSSFKFYGISQSKKNFSFSKFFNKLFKKNNNEDGEKLKNILKINPNNVKNDSLIEGTEQSTNKFLKNQDYYKLLQDESISPEFKTDKSMKENLKNDNEENVDEKTKIDNSSLKVANVIQNKNSVESLKEKYELYKNYDKSTLIEKDNDFGEVIKYEEFLDKGLDKFDNTLTKFYQENQSLTNNENYQNLSKLVDEKSRLFYSNYKEEYKYNLAPYEERWYKEAIYSRSNNTHEFIKVADNMKKRSNPIRNRTEFAQVFESTAKSPLHAQYPTKVETPFEAFVDYYQYLFNKNTKEAKKFLKSENQYKNKITFKYNHIYDEILGEFCERDLLSPKCAFQINENYIVFQKSDDDLSLFAVNPDTVEPIQRGFISNEYKVEELFDLDELNEKAEKNHFETESHKPRKSLFGNLFKKEEKSFDNQTKYQKKKLSEYEKNNFDIKQIFGLEDLINLNSVYTDPVFLDFSKRLIEKLDNDETGLESFEICPKNQYLFLFFDVINSTGVSIESESSEMNSSNNNIKDNLNIFNFEADSSYQSKKQYDILIKDLKNGILLPIVLHNCDSNIAFDKFDGLFYTQKDITGRFSKIFRHQIGVAQRNDKLIYHEKNRDFKVSTYNCNSHEYIYLEISTVSSPKINEIWFKPTNDLDKIDFLCFKKIEKNVNYKIKFANNTFYMLINKTDSYDKILKKIVWSKNNTISGMLEHSKIKKESNQNENNSKNKELVNIENHSSIQMNNNIEGFIEAQNLENFSASPLTLREDIGSEAEKNKLSDIYTDIILYDIKSNNLLKIVQDIIKSSDSINIIDFQVFKNYIAVLEEFEKKRQIKIINLKTNQSYLHEPDNEKTLVNFSENYNYNSNYLRYIQSSPISSHTITDYSMGTRKSYKIHKNFYSKINFKNYESEILNISDREGEAVIPVQIFFNKHLYNTDSPVILYTKGSQGRKQDFEFDSMLFSLLDRGFVWAIPQIRGTKFFDFDWYSQGIAENKIKHLTDYIDVAMHLLENKITERLVLYGDGYSGGITASVAFLQNPEEYQMLLVNNGAFDVFDLCMFGSRNVQILEEFGDIKNKAFYELIKMYSPYHSILPLEHKPILICSEEQNDYFTHGMKFAAKLRNNNLKSKFKNHIIFESFEDKFSYEEKIAFIYSQIVGNLYYN